MGVSGVAGGETVLGDEEVSETLRGSGDEVESIWNLGKTKQRTQFIVLIIVEP